MPSIAREIGCKRNGGVANGCGNGERGGGGEDMTNTRRARVVSEPHKDDDDAGSKWSFMVLTPVPAHRTSLTHATRTVRYPLRAAIVAVYTLPRCAGARMRISRVIPTSLLQFPMHSHLGGVFVPRRSRCRAITFNRYQTHTDDARSREREIERRARERSPDASAASGACVISACQTMRDG